VTAQYVWSRRYIDAPVLRDENKDSDDDCTESGTDERLYYTTDANMNVTALVATDGDVVERYMYDPYGQVLVLNGADDADDQVSEWSEDADNTSDWDNELLFAGYWRDAETGLYHVRNRMYHVRLGLWLQRDRLRRVADTPEGGAS
jgi:RHS repeat-associated protein